MEEEAHIRLSILSNQLLFFDGTTRRVQTIHDGGEWKVQGMEREVVASFSWKSDKRNARLVIVDEEGEESVDGLGCGEECTLCGDDVGRVGAITGFEWHSYPLFSFFFVVWNKNRS